MGLSQFQMILLTEAWGVERIEGKLEPGTVISWEIQFVESSTIFHASETLRLEISGKYGVENDLLKQYKDLVNEGEHTLHTGGEHASYLPAPVVPVAAK